MSEAAAHLQRWREAGLIDAALQERLLSFESGRTGAGPAHGTRPSLTEALLYLGIGVACAGVAALLGQNWNGLNGGLRLLVLGAPGVLALLAGLLLRRTGQPALSRSAGILWLVSVALLGATAGEAGELIGWSGRLTALGAGGGMSLLAAALWRLQPSRPQLLALAGAVVILGEALTAQVRPFHPELAGILLLSAGLAGIMLVEYDILLPAGLAATLGAGLALLGVLHVELGNGAAWSALPAVALGGLLLAFSQRRTRYTYLVAGVVTWCVGLVVFVFQQFADTIGVPAALLISGCVLVAAVVAVADGLRRRAGGLPAPGNDLVHGV